MPIRSVYVRSADEALWTLADHVVASDGPSLSQLVTRGLRLALVERGKAIATRTGRPYHLPTDLEGK